MVKDKILYKTSR